MKKLHIFLALTLGILASASILTGFASSAAPAILAQSAPNAPVAWTFTTKPLSVTVRYVRGNGSDAGNHCTDPAAPCATVQHAVDAASSAGPQGDEVRVAAGTYTTINNYGGHAQIVYITKTLLIRGGYSPDFSDWDPDAHLTTLDADGGGRVVYISGNISPTVEGFTITGGNATGLGGGLGDAGGGVYIVTATALISDNLITGNVAATDGWDDGLGGGLSLFNSNAQIVNNIISANDASTAGSPWGGAGQGGGLYADGGAPTLGGNSVINNQSSTGVGFLGFGSGGGLAFVESEPSVEANDIRSNRAVGSGDTGSGGGVELAGCPDFTLTNNIIADNTGGAYGGNGVYIGAMSGVPSSGRLLHNTVSSNRDASGSGGIYVATGTSGSRSTVTMINTIVTDHDVGVAVGGSTNAFVSLHLTRTLWGEGAWANSTNWEIYGGDPPTHTITSTLPITGTPGFLNPGGGDYHITVASDAIDAGVDAGVSLDIDGEARDASPDIGADEVGGHGLQVIKTASAANLSPGDTLTYTIAITGAGTLGVTGVTVTDTLPARQRPLTVSPACSIVTPGYGGEVVCAVGDLNAGQGAHITLTAQVTTTLPVTLPWTMRNTALAIGDQAQNETYADTVLDAGAPNNCHARVNGALPEYTAIQAAVDAASPGDTIWIAGQCEGAIARGGLSQQLYLTKTLTLRGGYSTDFAAWDPETYPTTLDAGGEGRVLLISDTASVSAAYLTLTGGDATGQGGLPDIIFNDVGGGLYVINATLTLSHCLVTDNLASGSYSGMGGGVGVTTATLTLVETTLADNTASNYSWGLGYGGGLFASASTVRLERSRLEGNQAANILPGTGGGAYFSESDLEANATLWLSNTASSAVDWGQGGGIYVEGSRPFTLTNCVLADNRAYDGSGESGSGMWVDGAAGVILQPTFARNRPGEGLTADYTATVVITNAAIISHQVGIRALGHSTVTVNGVLWHDNISDTLAVSATIQASSEITGTPAFAPDGYHITRNSAARDAGLISGVDDDVDGDSRPWGGGYDLGADEYLCRALSGVSLAGPRAGFTGRPYSFLAAVTPVTTTLPVTYTWQADGQSTASHRGSITDVVTYTWNITGSQFVTVTGVNECGVAFTESQVITIEVCTALTDISVAGPPTSTLGQAAAFTATVVPPGARLPITYTWEATGQTPATQGGNISDTVVFTWQVTGSQVVTVTAANECGTIVSHTQAIIITNQPPVAEAGPDQDVQVSAAVTLDGSGSADPDGHLPLAYSWTQTGGTAVVLSSASVSQPTFNAPGTPDVLTFTLTVTDSYGLADPTSDMVTISITGWRIYLPLVVRK